MKIEVMTHIWNDKDFFFVDEDTTANELVLALLKMKNGNIILHNILKMFSDERVYYENEKADHP